MIRRFQFTDVSAIEAILAESPEAAAWSTEALELINANNRLAWVTENDGCVIGFLATRIIVVDEAEVLNLAVVRTHRRTGAATNLLTTAIAELTRQHVRRLHLEVRESNFPATSLYKKLGFTQVGRRPNYYRDPDEAAVLLVKELTA